MYVWSARHEFFLLAVVLNRYPNLTYVVVVVLIDDSDEMVTYGIIMVQIVNIFCSPSISYLSQSRTILISIFSVFFLC